LADAIAFFDEDGGDALRANFGHAPVARIYDDLERRLTPHATRDGVRLPAAAWLIEARR
jgi:hypothetical protein